MTQFMEKLNPAQHAAVVSKAQVEIILAGPGSGKTRVLTSRVAWLVRNEHADPSRIVVVTFTNKAAKEMRERLEAPELLGRNRSNQLLMGTFHSLCARLLRKHGGLVNIKTNFTIADRDLSIHVIKNLKEELKGTLSLYGQTRIKPDAYLNEISKAKNSGMTVNMYVEAYKDKFEKKDFCIMFRAYEERLMEENIVDFDNLLIFGRDLMKNFPDVVDFVTHILVDEFQDTNVVQYDFLSYLTQTNKSLTAVGDPDQSIFGWRCADRGNFEKLMKQYPGCEIKSLEENYRSTKSILTGATHVIKIDKKRPDKSLFTGNHAGVPISFLRFESDQMEANSVAEEIRRVVDHSNGLITYKDVAVLMRVNYMSRNVEQALARVGIPYVVVGGVKFFDRAEVKDIISYVRFFHNTNDTEAFERIINKPKRGIGAVNLKKMQTMSRQRDWNVIRVLRAAVEDKGSLGLSVTSKTKECIKEFLQLYADYKYLVRDNEPISVILQYIVDAIDYKSFLIAQHKDKSGESRWDNVGELVSFAKAGFDVLSKAKQSSSSRENAKTSVVLEDVSENERLGGIDPVASFLEATTLSSNVHEEEEASKGKVTLTTMHSAKGLEWPVVFAIGLESGIVPHKMSTDTMEECRLLYVAMTRAKCFLYVSYALTRTSWGSENAAKVSSFLEGFSEEHCMHSTPNWDAQTRRWVSEVLRIDLPDESTAKDTKGTELWAPEDNSPQWGGMNDDYDDDDDGSDPKPKIVGGSARPYSTFTSAAHVAEKRTFSKQSYGTGTIAGSTRAPGRFNGKRAKFFNQGGAR